MKQTQLENYFHIRIELNNLKPAIWREVIVPAEISLGWLHQVIQVAMGWQNSHLHEFEHQRQRYGSTEYDEFEELIDEDTVPLSALFKRKGSRMTYSYDFGDDWEHEISLLKTLPSGQPKPFAYVAGTGTCPPEDCGGPGGFADLLEALYLRKEKGDSALAQDQLETLEWIGDFDPELPANHGSRVEANLKKVGNWAAKPAEELDEDDFEGDDEEFADFVEFMTTSAQRIAATDEKDFEGGFDPYEDEDEVPAPYSDLSADEAASYAHTMALANEVRKAAPWKILYESDLFGIEDPETGQLDIVATLGASKRDYALQVYRPPSGLYFWKTALTDDTAMTPDFLLEHCRMIEAEFLNKGKMEPHDLALYTATATATPGKGPQQWVRLRSNRPRTWPHFGLPGDLPALDRALRLYPRFIQEIQDDPELHVIAQSDRNPLPKELPVFRLEGKYPKDPAAWKLTPISVDWASVQAEPKTYLASEFEVETLAQAPVRKETWELGSIYLPSPVMTVEGPVLIVVSFAAPHAPEVDAPEPHFDLDPTHKPAQALWLCLAEAVEQRGYLPSQIHVGTEHAAATFAPLIKATGIQVKQLDFCPLVDPMLKMMAMSGPQGD